MNETADSLLPARVGSLEDVHDEWNRLATGTRNVFSTWEWNSVWWKHFGGSKTLLIHACRSNDGRTVALLPLYLWRRHPFRVVRFLGHHEGDQLGPICLPTDRPAVADALNRVLSDRHIDVFVAERLGGEEEWSDLLSGTKLLKDASPVLRFPSSTWEGLLKSRSRNFREQARRKERKLKDRHNVQYRLANEPDRLDEDLDVLFALHALRWAGTRTTFKKYEAFHREFAACALERGWLRLWFLDVDGEPRAACYGLRFGDVESFYQSGRDPNWDQHSVGFIVFLHAIREALADGMTEYRLLRGAESYKYRFANEDHGLETIAITRTRMSGLALTIVATARRSTAFQKLSALSTRA